MCHKHETSHQPVQGTVFQSHKKLKEDLTENTQKIGDEKMPNVESFKKEYELS